MRVAPVRRVLTQAKVRVHLIILYVHDLQLLLVSAQLRAVLMIARSLNDGAANVQHHKIKFAERKEDRIDKTSSRGYDTDTF